MAALPISKINEGEDDDMDERTCKAREPSRYRLMQSNVDENLKRPCDFV